MWKRINQADMRSALRRAHVDGRVEAATILGYLGDCLVAEFGPDIRQEIIPEKLRDKTAFLVVASTVAAGELRLREQQILERVNSRFHHSVVEKLSTRVAVI
ncbi:MAG: DciA family protein [bacterium]|nr:DciA family protein [bacterium]